MRNYKDYARIIEKMNYVQNYAIDRIINRIILVGLVFTELFHYMS